MRLKTANIIKSPVTATQRITAKSSVPIARKRNSFRAVAGEDRQTGYKLETV